MKFKVFCDLLSNLEAIAVRDPPPLPKAAEEKSRNEIIQWFRSHRTIIDSQDTHYVALLSALFPARRTDRVYGLQPPSLTKILSRCLELGSSRRKDLERWKQPGCGDLADCVERVLSQAEFPLQTSNEVTVDQIDATLTDIASRNHFSGPNIRAQNAGISANTVGEKLSYIYLRLQSREAKWFTRMILKDYSPVMLPEGLVFGSFHHLLPTLLKIHDNFEAACTLLKGPEIGQMNPMPGSREAKTQKALAAKIIVPRTGVKIGRPHFFKLRSVKHAMQVAYGRMMSLERKYDGEYCQIQIDLLKEENEIQIFSKSGKDSTFDRAGLHDTIRRSLRIGEDDCRFTRQCILEGELLVWDDQREKMLEFHKVRKHVSRSGVFLGTGKDSQPHPWEHLMVIFLDVMLMDDDAVMNQPYVRRRQLLQDLVRTIPGRADLAMVQEINFSGSNAPKQLLQALAIAFTQRWEGYVLKPCDDPYVNFNDHQHNTYRSCWFKLKRDYIKGLGDTADLAIVGAGYDAKEAKRLGITGLTWTYFHVGCLRNKIDVLHTGAKPDFLVIDAFNQSITKSDFKKLCQLGQFVAEKVTSPTARDTFDFSICSRLQCEMDTVFKKPFIFEVMGSGFDKPPNQDHFTLRFPRVVKILWDRNFKDAVGFDELQVLAAEARGTPEGDLSKDVSKWLERIKNSEGGKGVDQSWEDSQDNDSGSDLMLTPSTRSSPRRANASQTVFFVRTDTEEMLSTEKRLQSVEVTSRSLSPDAATTDASWWTLTSAPSSFVKATRNVAVKQSPALLQFSQRPMPIKRSADPEDRENNTQPSKKQCLDKPLLLTARRQRGSALLNHPDNLYGEESTNALSEITNSVRQRRTDTRRETTTPNPKSPPPRLTLVRKMTLGTEVRPYMKKKEKPPLLFSSARETTASDSSSARSSSPFLARGFDSIMPSPPSPQATVPPPRTPAIPHFSNCITVLSPCISSTPYLTGDLLAPYNGDVLSPADTSSLTTPESHDKQIILLVESRRSKPTARFLQSLYPILRQSRRTMEIWDWRVLELKAPAAGDGGAAKGRKKCFIGRMRMTGVTEARVEWASGPASIMEKG